MEKDMRLTMLGSLMVLLLLSGCGMLDTGPGGPNPSGIEQAKQDVYRVVASKFCEKEVISIHREVALYQGDGSEIERVHSELPDMSEETWESFLLANDPAQQSATFSDFPVSCSYEFASEPSRGCYTGEGTCIAPYGFSQIGFDKAGKQALIYVYRDCTECAGWGGLFLLEMKSGFWKIRDFVELWFS